METDVSNRESDEVERSHQRSAEDKSDAMMNATFISPLTLRQLRCLLR